ncbi:hypothetical protein CPB86DRAFT_781330 [Serendipita vermifera]|nr:hypothetical protein CPB86DRAFT_781330 [Serendipita vermifera]
MATRELGSNGQWVERDKACASEIQGNESYLRHVIESHLKVPRKGKLMEWAKSQLGDTSDDIIP